MKFLSICSGIEAASVAWNPLGWEACGFAEIEKFPSAVLAHHWPDIPNMGDMTRFHEWPSFRPDLLVGGTPCQAFSVAGLRKGLEDPRGNLTLVFLGILERYRPTWVVWENVPGVLSDKTGAFGALLGGLGELGYGFAYRILDAQHFGVPQRRRRVFVVGYLGDWRRAAAVLFEPESLRWHHPPSREAGQRVAPTLDVRAGRSGETSFHTSGGLIAHSLRAEGFDASEDGTGRGTPLVPVAFAHQAGGTQTNLGYDESVDTCMTLGANQTPAVAFAQNTRDEVREMHVVGALAAQPGMKQTSYIRQATQVRRLTPLECERLQGFPDNHTLIPWRGGMSPDGPRYKALGNSMAVPVMRWIGERIQSIHNLPR